MFVLEERERRTEGGKIMTTNGWVSWWRIGSDQVSFAFRGLIIKISCSTFYQTMDVLYKVVDEAAVQE